MASCKKGPPALSILVKLLCQGTSSEALSKDAAGLRLVDNLGLYSLVMLQVFGLERSGEVVGPKTWNSGGSSTMS